jgi:hypothetical protein
VTRPGQLFRRQLPHVHGRRRLAVFCGFFGIEFVSANGYFFRGSFEALT